MVRCNFCGVEYSLGRKIYHECENNIIRHGVIFTETKCAPSWNCYCVEHGKEEISALESPYFEKPHHALLFE